MNVFPYTVLHTALNRCVIVYSLFGGWWYTVHHIIIIIIGRCGYVYEEDTRFYTSFYFEFETRGKNKEMKMKSFQIKIL